MHGIFGLGAEGNFDRMWSNFEIWMTFVALLRAFGVFNAWVTPQRIRTNVYSRNSSEVTTLLTRMFGLWTALSGSICVALVLDSSNKTLLGLGLFSFLLALVHFITELFIFKTCSVRDASIPFVIASVSIVVCATTLTSLPN